MFRSIAKYSKVDRKLYLLSEFLSTIFEISINFWTFRYRSSLTVQTKGIAALHARKARVIPHITRIDHAFYTHQTRKYTQMRGTETFNNCNT